MAVLIARNTHVPTKKSQVFSTTFDNQDKVIVKVFEGERPMTKDNHLLGTFELTGIAPSPRGIPQIEVTFEIDVNSILTVYAQDKQNNNIEKYVVTSDKSRLSQEEIERMIKNAEEMKEEDQKVKDTVSARNDLEGYVYNTRNSIEDPEKISPKLTEEDIKTIKDAVQDGLKWLQDHPTGTKEEYNEKKMDLEKIIHPLTVKATTPDQKDDNPSDNPEDPSEDPNKENMINVDEDQSIKDL